MSIHKGQKIERPHYRALWEQERRDKMLVLGFRDEWKVQAEKFRDDYSAQVDDTRRINVALTGANLATAYYRQWAIRFGVAALLEGLTVLGLLIK